MVLRPAFVLALCVAAAALAPLPAWGLATATICGTADARIACTTSARLPMRVAVANASTTPNGTACSGTTNAVVGIVCSSANFGTLTPAATSTRCATEGQNVVCTGGSVLATLCVGTQCAGCGGTPLAVAGITCQTSSLVTPNMSSLQWRYGDSWQSVGCNEKTEMLVGMCASRSHNWCGGRAAGALCAATLGRLNVSYTTSTSVTNTPSVATTLSTTASVLLTPTSSGVASATRSVTASVTQLPTPSMTRSLTKPPTRTPTPPRTLTRTVELTPSATVSRTPDDPITPTATISLPSRTRVPTPTKSETLVRYPGIVGPMPPLSVRMVQATNTSVLLALENALWNLETAQFIPLVMEGSQKRNPFGFSSRRDALIANVELVSPTVLRIAFRRDTCFEPHDAEVVTVTATPEMVTPAFPVTQTFELSSIWPVPREAVGLTLVILTGISALVSLALGSVGAMISTVWMLQTAILIGSNACSRFRIAAYLRLCFWVTKSTLRNTAFAAANDEFGVVVTHVLIAVLPIALHYALAKRLRRLRRFWPAFPQVILSMLFQGTTHAGWFVVLSEEIGTAYRATTFIIMVFFIAGNAAFLYKFTVLRGLLFLRFPAGNVRRIFSGAWAPAQLRSKYAPVIELWNPDVMRYAFGAYFVVHVLSALLMAIEPATMIGCMALHSVALTLHGSFFLVLLYIRPARNIPHNAILLTQQFSLCMLLTGTVASLDCSAPFPDNVNGGETLLVFCLCVALLCSVANNILGVVEHRLLKKAVEEDKAMQGKVAEAEEMRLRGEMRLENKVVPGTDEAENAILEAELGPQPSPRDKASPTSELQNFQLREFVAEDQWVTTQYVSDAQRQAMLAESGPQHPKGGRFDVEVPPEKKSLEDPQFKRSAMPSMSRQSQSALSAHSPDYAAPLALELEPRGGPQSPRRALLGAYDPARSCPNCRKFVGSRTLCVECRKASALASPEQAADRDHSPPPAVPLRGAAVNPVRAQYGSASPARPPGGSPETVLRGPGPVSLQRPGQARSRSSAFPATSSERPYDYGSEGSPVGLWQGGRASSRGTVRSSVTAASTARAASIQQPPLDIAYDDPSVTDTPPRPTRSRERQTLL